MTDINKVNRLANELRALGCAVTVFVPEELNEADPKDVQDCMAQAGVAAIDYFGRLADSGR